MSYNDTLIVLRNCKSALNGAYIKYKGILCTELLICKGLKTDGSKLYKGRRFSGWSGCPLRSLWPLGSGCPSGAGCATLTRHSLRTR